MSDNKALETLEARVTELETRFAFDDDTLDQLSDTLARQQREIEELKRAVQLLHEQLRTLQEQPSGTPGEEPPPPHY